MKDEYADFQYRPLLEIPKEYRQVDWTYIRVIDRPFSEGVQAFDELRETLRQVFAEDPFLWLHFLRAIEGRLLMLAVDTRQPISKCMEHLRKRLDLEYDRDGIYGKAAQLVVLAKYLVESGEHELARTLLLEERAQLKETAVICESWVETIDGRIEELAESGD